MSLPTEREIRALHRAHAPSAAAFRLVLGHCETVWRIARLLLRELPTPVDTELVRAGCLLHDIGVYRLYGADGRLDEQNYVRHGVLGHELLAAEGFPEQLCRFCSCHTGVGLSPSDVVEQRLPIPPGDYVARTVEERLVMYADKFHSKSRPARLLTYPEYAAHVGRFGTDKVRRFAALADEFGLPETSSITPSRSRGPTA
ncbi:HD domain-containing protein [Streptomyces lonarensis]|uniref:HDIG domain-containing protein n=1 Tax=Streptomyces lonarensis TaxID=700599 RepID=A0A7X6HYM1_9ACTN|nr:HD domain-containing protein [Streptomyces lonarensis]NJQ05354.1 HDIG domain-containing protein [Streptomyces lonarensis]